MAAPHIFRVLCAILRRRQLRLSGPPAPRGAHQMRISVAHYELLRYCAALAPRFVDTGQQSVAVIAIRIVVRASPPGAKIHHNSLPISSSASSPMQHHVPPRPLHHCRLGRAATSQASALPVEGRVLQRLRGRSRAPAQLRDAVLDAEQLRAIEWYVGISKRKCDHMAQRRTWDRSCPSSSRSTPSSRCSPTCPTRCRRCTRSRRPRRPRPRSAVPTTWLRATTMTRPSERRRTALRRAGTD